VVFERKGWMSDTVKELPVNFGSLPAYGEGSSALAAYLEAYRRELNKAGSPEAAWDAMAGGLKAPAKASAGTPAWLKMLLALLLLAALGLAYWFGMLKR
jgi:hypothetical protein